MLTKTAYIPCDENDERCVGGFTSLDGRSLCYVREIVIPDSHEQELWDEYSEMIGSDIFDLEMFAGRDVITRSSFHDLFKKINATISPATVSNDAHEKEVMMQAFHKVNELFHQRTWIMEGRGSYPYNDDRYKEEVRYLYDEFDALYKDTWKNIESKSFEYRNKIIEEYKASVSNGDAASQSSDEGGCNICGGPLVLIRGKYPNDDKRKVCPTCNTERLEQINEISSKTYGVAFKQTPSSIQEQK